MYGDVSLANSNLIFYLITKPHVYEFTYKHNKLINKFVLENDCYTVLVGQTNLLSTLVQNDNILILSNMFINSHTIL